MPASMPQPANSPKKQSVVAKKIGGKPMSWQEFQQKYLDREDGFKYEWVGGMVEKTKHTMDKTQLYILHNLKKFFRQLLIERKVNGELIAEPDLFFLDNHRRPDIAWLTERQIYALADPSGYEVPAFIIEIISGNDQMNHVKKKMINYRDAGVKVVWHIFPNLHQVDVYAGPSLDQMTVCDSDKICSAAPALPAFQIPVGAIFYKPEKTV